jgi:predicted O-methyltransferase YrrM
MLRGLRRSARDARRLPALAALPREVALFQWRAWRLAASSGDEFALVSATRPRDLAVLLAVARSARRVIELGTGSGWTAISLALAEPGRRVVSYDPEIRPLRESYLRLVAPEAQSRVHLVAARGDRGPVDDDDAVDLLYVDSAHDREGTIREIEAWRPVLKPDSIIVFDDYSHEGYPGVKEAVQALGLAGAQHGTLFVHRVP